MKPVLPCAGAMKPQLLHLSMLVYALLAAAWLVYTGTLPP